MKNILFVLAVGILSMLALACDEKNDDVDSSWEETWVVASQTVSYGSDETFSENDWIKRNGSEEWTMTSATVAGFDYEEGYEYVILVKATPAQGEIPQDASSVYYSLIEIISKEEKTSDVPF